MVDPRVECVVQGRPSWRWVPNGFNLPAQAATGGRWPKPNVWAIPRVRSGRRHCVWQCARNCGLGHAFWEPHDLWNCHVVCGASVLKRPALFKHWYRKFTLQSFFHLQCFLTLCVSPAQRPFPCPSVSQGSSFGPVQPKRARTAFKVGTLSAMLILFLSPTAGQAEVDPTPTCSSATRPCTPVQSILGSRHARCHRGGRFCHPHVFFP